MTKGGLIQAEEILTWVTEGEPKAQPRPRAASFGGKARIYNPSTADEYKKSIGVDMLLSAKERGVELPIDGEIFMDICLFFKRPKRLCRKKDPDEAIWHTSKPDCDNVAKSILDAIVQVEGITDDRAVSCLQVSKKWVAKDGIPRTEVIILKEQGRDAHSSKTDTRRPEGSPDTSP